MSQFGARIHAGYGREDHTSWRGPADALTAIASPRIAKWLRSPALGGFV